MHELDLVHKKRLKQNNSALQCVGASLKKIKYQFIAKTKYHLTNVQLCFRKDKLEKKSRF